MIDGAAQCAYEAESGEHGELECDAYSGGKWRAWNFVPRVASNNFRGLARTRYAPQRHQMKNKNKTILCLLEFEFSPLYLQN